MALTCRGACTCSTCAAELCLKQTARQLTVVSSVPDPPTCSLLSVPSPSRSPLRTSSSCVWYCSGASSVSFSSSLPHDVGLTSPSPSPSPSRLPQDEFFQRLLEDIHIRKANQQALRDEKLRQELQQMTPFRARHFSPPPGACMRGAQRRCVAVCCSTSTQVSLLLCKLSLQSPCCGVDVLPGMGTRDNSMGNSPHQRSRSPSPGREDRNAVQQPNQPQSSQAVAPSPTAAVQGAAPAAPQPSAAAAGGSDQRRGVGTSAQPRQGGGFAYW